MTATFFQMLRAPATSVPHVIVARETGIEGIIGEAGVRAVTSVAIRCLIGGPRDITLISGRTADAGTIGLQLTRRP